MGLSFILLGKLFISLKVKIKLNNITEKYRVCFSFVVRKISYFQTLKVFFHRKGLKYGTVRPLCATAMRQRRLPGHPGHQGFSF